MPERDYSHRTLIEKLNIKDDAYPFLPNSSGSFATLAAISRAKLSLNKCDQRHRPQFQSGTTLVFTD